MRFIILFPPAPVLYYFLVVSFCVIWAQKADSRKKRPLLQLLASAAAFLCHQIMGAGEILEKFGWQKAALSHLEVYHHIIFFECIGECNALYH